MKCTYGDGAVGRITSCVWPSELLERDQWMGHVDETPFAPWDGRGHPAVASEALLEGHETSLRHGSGLGLRLARWAVTASGGDLRFEENDPRGSVVILRLPRGDPPADGPTESTPAASAGSD